MYTFYLADLGLAENTFSNVDWALHGKKDTFWGNNKQEPMSDSILLPFRDNEYVPISDEFLSDEEDTISNASDITITRYISIAKRYDPFSIYIM